MSELKDEINKIKKVQVINVRNIGMVLIFFSWLSQYYYYADYSSKRAELEYDMTFIANEISIITPWLIAFNLERKKGNPDEEVIWNSSRQFVLRVAEILKVAEKHYSENIAEKELTYDKTKNILIELNKYRAEKNIDEIISLTQFVMLAFPEIGEISREHIDEIYSVLREEEFYWRNIFLAFYILGSIMIAIGYIILKSKEIESPTNKSSGRKKPRHIV
jgi:hypothetical protein